MDDHPTYPDHDSLAQACPTGYHRTEHGSPFGRFVDEERAIVDSFALPSTDVRGNPIAVSIPIELAQGTRIVYSTRLGGTSQGDFAICNLGGSVGDDPERVMSNRQALAAQAGAPLSLVRQVHSGRCLDVDDPNLVMGGNDYAGLASSVAVNGHEDQLPSQQQPLSMVQADAQVSSRTALALGIFAADCLPVLLADADAGVIAAAHCGRRGLQRGIIGSTVAMMRVKGARPEHIVATLGPSICGDCYEVGQDIADEFNTHFPGTITRAHSGGPGVDIRAAACQALAHAGVGRSQLVDSSRRVSAATQYLSEDSELSNLCQQDQEGDPDLSRRLDKLKNVMCTLENPLWYSHRRAVLAGKAHEGRLLALVLRRP